MPKSSWSESDIKFLCDNHNKMYYKDIAKLLGKSERTVCYKAIKLGFRKVTRRFWNSEEEQYLIDNYSNMPIKKIAEVINRSYMAIALKAMLLGLKVEYSYHEPSYNDMFFDTWSKELGWFVGVVLSDGHVSNMPNNKFVRIKMCDRDVIEKLGTLTDYKLNILEFDSKEEKHSASFTISFNGRKIWDFFTDLGMDNNKSTTAFLPDIPEQHFNHFVRGVFDGDGSIYLTEKNYPYASICGTKKVVYGLADILGIKHNIHKYSDVTFSVQYTGKRAIEFLNFIYKDSQNIIRMDRKYDKYKKALKYFRW